MVNIIHHLPDATVPDLEALEFFRNQWTLYSKLVRHNQLFHIEVRELIRDQLRREFAGPIRVLDLACGDASAMVSALTGLPIAHYHGVDLAEPALEMAAENLEALGCELELEQADFIEAMRERPEAADLVWIGLSLHHLDTADKLELLREIRGVLDPTGRLMVYDPTIPDGEDLVTFHRREEDIIRNQWAMLTEAEREAAVRHIHASDLPETVSDMLAMGHEAAFSGVEQCFVSPSNIYRMFVYRP
jgi:SAM-dependent methyltransferase